MWSSVTRLQALTRASRADRAPVRSSRRRTRRTCRRDRERSGIATRTRAIAVERRQRADARILPGQQHLLLARRAERPVNQHERTRAVGRRDACCGPSSSRRGRAGRRRRDRRPRCRSSGSSSVSSPHESGAGGEPAAPSLSSSRIEPHSRASTRSASPSPSMSANSAADTRPTSSQHRDVRRIEHEPRRRRCETARTTRRPG